MSHRNCQSNHHQRHSGTGSKYLDNYQYSLQSGSPIIIIIFFTTTTGHPDQFLFASSGTCIVTVSSFRHRQCPSSGGVHVSTSETALTYQLTGSRNRPPTPAGCISHNVAIISSSATGFRPNRLQLLSAAGSACCACGLTQYRYYITSWTGGRTFSHAA